MSQDIKIAEDNQKELTGSTQMAKFYGFILKVIFFSLLVSEDGASNQLEPLIH